MKNKQMEETLRKIKEATEYELGGWENQAQDYPKDSEEYKEAKSFLDLPAEGKIEIIYRNIMGNMEKEVRFVGKETCKFMIGFVIAQNA